MIEGRRDAGDEAEFITFQRASKEFGIYPSTIRAWLRSGLIAPEFVVNLVVQRGALMRAMEAVGRAADPNEAVALPTTAEIELARRILNICTSHVDSATKLKVVQSVAQSVIDRIK